MKPVNHRIIELTAAIPEFKIDELLGKDFEDLIIDMIDEDASVLVFDGDTGFTDDIGTSEGSTFGEPHYGYDLPLIIVNGNLSALNINMTNIKGLLVLGNLSCKKICFKEFYPVYVQGNLVAESAILAIAEQEGPFLGHETFGPLYARIQGTVSSPNVRTWFMPLKHLKWVAGSGEEYAEDIEDPGKENWFSDPIWNF